jgi:2-polyprenyl-3-methyl-5-hydroxy-6-metoxy-1,4-benzoquinol methylase
MSDQPRRLYGEFEPEREPPARRYVKALSALDSAAGPSSQVGRSAAAAAADAVRMNALWNQGAPEPNDDSLGGRIRRVFVEVARWMPWRRRRVQGAMIAAINRNVETTRALIDATQTFQAHVVWYAQTVQGLIPPPARPLPVTNRADVEVLEQAMRALGSDWLKHWESLAAREQRYDARTAALTKAYENVLEVATLAQQSTISLKRTVDTLAAARSSAPGDAAAASASSATASSPAASSQAASSQAASSPSASSPAAIDTNAYKYVVFEDRYRGSREEIQRRLAEYPPLFEGARNVLDIGCGRGELLGLLRDRGIEARGIDINDEMVEVCRSRGLTAERADALTYLSAQPDASLGGLIAIQVVEHLEPGYLMQLIDAAYQKLKPGAPMVFETINAACWAAFFDSYIRDFTHARPLHPDTLRYLVQASGFARVDIKYLAPVADQDKLPRVRMMSDEDATPTVVELVEGLNAHANRLNSQLFTYRDFAVVAHR